MPDHEPLTDDELDAIEARCAAATPGPWEFLPGHSSFHRDPIDVLSHVVDDDPELEPQITDILFGDVESEVSANWEFIMHARQDVPRLLDEVRRLTAELQQARDYIGSEMVASDFQTAGQMRAALQSARAECDRLRAEVDAFDSECDSIELIAAKRARAAVEAELGALEAENARLRHYRDTREAVQGKVLAAVEKISDHFDESGEIKGDGKWRLKSIYEAVKVIEAVSDDLCAVDNAGGTEETDPIVRQIIDKYSTPGNEVPDVMSLLIENARLRAQLGEVAEGGVK